MSVILPVSYRKIQVTNLAVWYCTSSSSSWMVVFHPLYSDGLFHLIHWKSPFAIKGVLGLNFLGLFGSRQKLLLANSGDSNQMPHYMASDLGLHCVPLLGFPRLNGLKCLKQSLHTLGLDTPNFWISFPSCGQVDKFCFKNPSFLFAFVQILQLFGQIMSNWCQGIWCTKV